MLVGVWLIWKRACAWAGSSRKGMMQSEEEPPAPQPTEAFAPWKEGFLWLVGACRMYSMLVWPASAAPSPSVPRCPAEVGKLKVPFSRPEAIQSQFKMWLTFPQSNIPCRNWSWNQLEGVGGRCWGAHLLVGAGLASPLCLQSHQSVAASCFPGGGWDGVWSWGQHGVVASRLTTDGNSGSWF